MPDRCISVLLTLLWIDVLSCGSFAEAWVYARHRPRARFNIGYKHQIWRRGVVAVLWLIFLAVLLLIVP